MPFSVVTTEKCQRWIISDLCLDYKEEIGINPEPIIIDSAVFVNETPHKMALIIIITYYRFTFFCAAT
jgi:hypothetical protein